VALVTFRFATVPVYRYKDEVSVRVLVMGSALPLGAIDFGANPDAAVDASIKRLQVPVSRVQWDVDDYGYPLCRIEPQSVSAASISDYLRAFADRSAVVEVDGRAVHVIRLAESSSEALVLRFGYPWRRPEDQPFRDS